MHHRDGYKVESESRVKSKKNSIVPLNAFFDSSLHRAQPAEFAANRLCQTLQEFGMQSILWLLMNCRVAAECSTSRWARRFFDIGKEDEKRE